jgi:hypothetical protein
VKPKRTQAQSREAVVVKGRLCKSGDDVVKDCFLTWVNLVLCLKGRCASRSEKSAEAVVVFFFLKGAKWWCTVI